MRGGRKRGKEKEREIAAIGSLPKCLVPGLGQRELREMRPHASLPSG